MIYVVLRATNEIKHRIDAWDTEGEQKMRQWISEHGYVLTDIEYTVIGDMVMWIE